MIPKLREIVNSERLHMLWLFGAVFFAILALLGALFLVILSHDRGGEVFVEYQAFEPGFRATSTMPYVASAGGEMYYPVGCNGANRIHKKNRLYLESIAQAEGLGYRRSTRCAY